MCNKRQCSTPKVMSVCLYGVSDDETDRLAAPLISLHDSITSKML